MTLQLLEAMEEVVNMKCNLALAGPTAWLWIYWTCMEILSQQSTSSMSIQLTNLIQMTVRVLRQSMQPAWAVLLLEYLPSLRPSLLEYLGEVGIFSLIYYEILYDVYNIYFTVDLFIFPDIQSIIAINKVKFAGESDKKPIFMHVMLII